MLVARAKKLLKKLMNVSDAMVLFAQTLGVNILVGIHLAGECCVQSVFIHVTIV